MLTDTTISLPFHDIRGLHNMRDKYKVNVEAGGYIESNIKVRYTYLCTLNVLLVLSLKYNRMYLSITIIALKQNNIL